MECFLFLRGESSYCLRVVIVYRIYSIINWWICSYFPRLVPVVAHLQAKSSWIERWVCSLICHRCVHDWSDWEYVWSKLGRNTAIWSWATMYFVCYLFSRSWFTLIRQCLTLSYTSIEGVINIVFLIVAYLLRLSPKNQWKTLRESLRLWKYVFNAFLDLKNRN